MGLFSKVIVLSACVVLGLAQDYEYSINQDKVSVRQNPHVPQSQFQAPSGSSNNFQPIQSSQLSKFNAIPQVKPNTYTPETRFQQPQTKPQHIFRPAAANTYVPQSSQNFVSNQANLNQAPVQRPAVTNAYIPQQQSSQNFASNNQAPVQRPAVTNAYIPQQQVSQSSASNKQVQPNFSQQPEYLETSQTSQFSQQPQQETFSQAGVRKVQKVRPSFSEQPEYVETPQFSQQPQQAFDQGVVRNVQKTRPEYQGPNADDLAIIQEQNAAAKYAFSSAVQDEINDSSQQRQETRDGLSVKGMYAYSDGFFKRVVEYEADENGYRIVNESAEPIGNGEGPSINLNGKAQVATNIDGANNAYSITADDVVDLRKFRKQPFQVIA